MDGANDELDVETYRKRNLYHMTFTKCMGSGCNQICAEDSMLELWHRQCKHLNVRIIRAKHGEGKNLGKTSILTFTLTYEHAWKVRNMWQSCAIKRIG